MATKITEKLTINGDQSSVVLDALISLAMVMLK